MERLRLHLPSKLFHHQGGSVMIRTAHPDPSEAQSSFRQEYCRQQRLPGDVLPPQFQGEALPNTRATLAETPASPPSLHAKDEITLRGATSRFLNAANLPVELLSIILEFIAFERAGGTLRDCASTCQLWSSVALPLLYRYCGFGVFDYMPPQPYRRQNSPAVVPYSDSPLFTGRPLSVSRDDILAQARYWRTLLLSCFWKEPTNRTLHPYIQFVENLDFLVLATVVQKYQEAHTEGSIVARDIRKALFGLGTEDGGFMVENFEKPQPREVPDGASILSRMMTVLIPRIGHLKSANVFMEHDLMYSSMQHQILRTTVTVPLTEAVGKLSRISSLEISGQENVTPEFGRAIQKLRPSIILNSSNSTISRNATFALRITGSRRIWQGSSGIGSSGSLDNLELSEELRRNKAFLAALNPNSVTSVDFDITDDWGWTPESVSDFLLRQARTLKILRIRGFGDTLSTWQLLDRMGRKGFRVRGLDLDNRHVQHPPVIFDPTAWALQTVFLKKLKYLAVDGFQGIMNSATNYHMIDPTQFSILLKSSLFGKVSGTRMTPPVKTLKLSGIRMGSKVPEQIGAWVMQLVPTLTTLEIGYLNYGHNPDSDFSYSAHCREQGRYKLIEVLSRLEKLRRFKATGYAAEILLCGCITPVDEEEEDDGLPRSPPRPSTPIGPSAVGSNWPHEASWHPSQVHYTKHRHPGRPSGGTKKRSPAAARLFEETWPETLEELELSPSYPIVFTMYNGFVDDSLMLFTKLERLRVLALLYRQERKGVSLLSAVNSEEDESQQRESSKDAMEKTGLLTPEGMLTFVKALPKMQHVEQKFMLKKFWLAERFMNPNARRELPNQDLSWTKAIGDMMKQMGTDFEFVNNCS